MGMVSSSRRTNERREAYTCVQSDGCLFASAMQWNAMRALCCVVMHGKWRQPLCTDNPFESVGPLQDRAVECNALQRVSTVFVMHRQESIAIIIIIIIIFSATTNNDYYSTAIQLVSTFFSSITERLLHI